MDAIQDRIKELINSEGLSNKEFASKMGMNPSIISHILSGRNKASLYVVENIKLCFTNVNLEYLITGEGGLYNQVTNVNQPNPEHETVNTDILEVQKAKEELPLKSPILTEEKEDKPLQVESEPKPYYSSTPPVQKTENKEIIDDIDQVIIFYKDGSFKRYQERKD